MQWVPSDSKFLDAPGGLDGTRCAEIFSARYALASRAGSACVDRLLADDMKQIAIAITCWFALAVLAALALQTVIWQWNLEAQQDQQTDRGTPLGAATGTTAPRGTPLGRATATMGARATAP